MLSFAIGAPHPIPAHIAGDIQLPSGWTGSELPRTHFIIIKSIMSARLGVSLHRSARISKDATRPIARRRKLGSAADYPAVGT